jgi:hypothetical protein
MAMYCRKGPTILDDWWLKPIPLPPPDDDYLI